MEFSRRSILAGSEAFTLAAGLNASDPKPSLPDKANFRVQEFETCLNAARWHPLSNGARLAAER